MSQVVKGIFKFGTGAVLLAFSLVACAQAAGSAAVSNPVDCTDLANAPAPACSGVPSLPQSPLQASPEKGVPYRSDAGDLYGRNATPADSAKLGAGMRTDRNPDYRTPDRPKEDAAAVSPPLPTGFQRMVQGAVGSMIPIFGSNLFTDSPATFAPVERGPVTADYIIGPDDEIALRVWGNVTFSRQLTVDRTGDIYIPQVGSVHVAGLHFAQLDAYLRSQISPVFRNFELSANMGRLRSIQIFVVGQARHPGSYIVSSQSTLMNALFATGGPTPDGSMRRIEVMRADKVITTFDLYDLLLKGHSSSNVPLLPGDVIYIPPVGSLVALAGSVNVPAIYELLGNETIENCIRLAGGESTMAAPGPAQLERTNSAGTRFTVDVPRDAAGLAMRLRAGDILRIPSIALRFEKTVTLRGNVANPGRYSWHPGMRVQDLIPNKESLESRGYWQQRIALGLPAPEYTPLAKATDEKNEKAELIHTAPSIDWKYAVVERVNAQDLSTSLVSFDLGQAIATADSSQNINLQPDDVVTIFSTSDIDVPQSQRVKYIHLDGEFIRAGVYSAEPGETLRQLIARAGGLTPQAYLYASNFLRLSTQKQQQMRYDQYVDQLQRDIEASSSNAATSTANAQAAATLEAGQKNQMEMIEKMRQMHSSGRVVLDFKPESAGIESVPDLPLEDGDRFVIPALPSTVNILGAVYSQDSYQYLRGERVGDYLKQAGGATRNADKGREFVIRANGSILSKQYAHGTLFTAGLDGRAIYPGDSVVVPTAVNRTSVLRGITDWSTVFSQFGLGIAALNLVGG